MPDLLNRQIAGRLEEVAHLLREQTATRRSISNTTRAHRLGKTHDWVVLYIDDGAGEHQYTVITAGRGPAEGRRIVAGREAERAPVAAHG